ncbi:hypothetical protein B0A52_06590 [Exophiala mesophila]|uniref:Fcf2 pre-rRNA processing C-terminal domain-containing protein n=1 Tax=Exophiala mesophila TaxID=212818 RepID=A0A438N1G9_EXOME|nr:hypothetical protein B0A52_06590 [Exophiala mesophila]
MATDVLTDVEIDQLLSQAESRLREKAGQLSTVTTEDEISLESNVAKSKARKPFPKLRHGLGGAGYLKDDNGVAQIDPKALTASAQQDTSTSLPHVGFPQKSEKINDQSSAGPDWFGLPKTDVTPQLKRDLQLIEMRSVLDPHRHYKKNNRKGKIPTFSQTGTVIEGPTEYFSSRINKKDRAKTFVEEAMNTERQNGRFKRKYGEIQAAKTSGKKEHYKKVLAKRKRP